MEITAKKIEANRENAKSSTGPTSPGGKAKVAANAIKHGLLAKAVVLKSTTAAESQSDFDTLLADLVADLQPTGPMEEAIVERIATCYWRLARAQRFEALALDSAPDPDAQSPEVLEIREKWQRTQAELDHRLYLDKLYDRSPESLTSEELDALEKWQAICDSGIGKIMAALGDKRDVLAVLANSIKTHESEIAELAVQLRDAEKRAATEKVRNTLAAFLPEGRDLLSVVRYESMLDRQIHRALMELKRLRSLGGDRPGPRRHLPTAPEESAS